MTSRLRVVVFGGRAIGEPVANRVARLPEVEGVSLIVATSDGGGRDRIGRLGRSIRNAGLLRAAPGLERLLPWSSWTSSADRRLQAELAPEVRLHECQTFAAESALSYLEGFDPQLGIIAGGADVPSVVRTRPALGSIELHLSEYPEHSGSPPGFWELYDGEDEVGVVVRKVGEEQGSGKVLVQMSAPLDRAPSLAPLAYLEEYRTAVLQPRGAALVALAVKGLAHGSVRPGPEEHGEVVTRPKPTRKQEAELRRRVRKRREEEST